jgi:hypothetical protein
VATHDKLLAPTLVEVDQGNDGAENQSQRRLGAEPLVGVGRGRGRGRGGRAGTRTGGGC